MSVVIAIDAGTTGVRVVRRCETTAPRPGSPTASSPSTSPGPGWVEHDAARDLGGRPGHPRRAGRAARRADRRHRHHRPARDRRGLGPPHRPAPSTAPSSGRTAARRLAATPSATEGLEPLVRSTTGLVLDPYFTATKAEWLLTEGGVRRHARPRASAPSTRGSCGTSPAGRTAACWPPSPPTRAARCSSTSARWRGPRSSSIASASRRRPSRRCARRAVGSA